MSSGWVRRVVAGGVSGFAATVPMTAFMLVADRLGRKGPEVIVRQALDAADVPRTRSEELAAIAAGHFGFGAGSGAVHGLLIRRPGGSGYSIRSGVLFGISLWAVNYQGWVPASGVLPPVTQDRPGRQGGCSGRMSSTVPHSAG